uniref:40S ribosomal protein S27 n=1 Tax=Poecilia reticulata TaxID=8081 RepID=A0A3P9PVV3_POERE
MLDCNDVFYFLPSASSFRYVTNVSFSLFLSAESLSWKHADMPLAKDLLHPSPEEEKRRHKKKRLVQSPNSYFMDVKCPGCYKITTVFSHAQTVVLCVGCSTVLCQPTGGKARLTEGCSFRRKQH